MSKRGGKKKREEDEPLSLHPLGFDEAVEALLKVKPPKKKKKRGGDGEAKNKKG